MATNENKCQKCKKKRGRKNCLDKQRQNHLTVLRCTLTPETDGHTARANHGRDWTVTAPIEEPVRLVEPGGIWTQEELNWIQSKDEQMKHNCGP